VADIDDYMQMGQDGAFLCWAAVGVSMTRFYREREMTQCEFVRQVRGLANCPDEPIALATALRGVPCLAADPIEGPISPEQLRAQISLDQPVCITITIEGFLRHVLVVVRCATGPNPLVTVLDPAHGGQRDQVLYDTLRAGGWGEGRGPWEETLLTG
jgi:hypothetical protein